MDLLQIYLQFNQTYKYIFTHTNFKPEKASGFFIILFLVFVSYVLIVKYKNFAKINIMKNIVEELKNLGFNSYESKVYIALLKKYPATGYEVSQLANIPQSRAYDALKSLAEDDVVIADNEKPQKYIPISPKELTARYKRRVNTTINYLEKNLPQLKEEYNEPLHNISGYETIMEK